MAQPSTTESRKANFPLKYGLDHTETDPSELAERSFPGNIYTVTVAGGRLSRCLSCVLVSCDCRKPKVTELASISTVGGTGGGRL